MRKKQIAIFQNFLMKLQFITRKKKFKFKNKYYNLKKNNFKIKIIINKLYADILYLIYIKLNLQY